MESNGLVINYYWRLTIKMKQMTEMENVIMSRSGVNRETANLIANDILQILDRDGDLKDPSDYDDLESLRIGQYHDLED